jgi:chromosome segregation ATPase
MRKALTPFVALIAAGNFCAAQEQNAAEARLRDALRQMTVRVQTAEAEAATLKATQTDLEAKNKDLTAKVEKLIKEAVADKTAADKAAATAEAKIAGRDAELVRTKEALEKWKAAHAQVTDLGRKAEAARIALAAKATSLEHRVADLTRKNLALFKIGSEVLTRLENFSYGTALAAREPFVGATRVKLENEVQGYKDKLLDPKLKP